MLDLQRDGPKCSEEIFFAKRLAHFLTRRWSGLTKMVLEIRKILHLLCLPAWFFGAHNLAYQIIRDIFKNGSLKKKKNGFVN
jgi:hypothetical protein